MTMNEALEDFLKLKDELEKHGVKLEKVSVNVYKDGKAPANVTIFAETK